MRLRAALLVVPAVALLAVAPAGAGAKRGARGRSVLVVGDSLTVGTHPYLGHFLPGWRVRTQVSISKQVTEGPPTLARYGRRLPRVVFVNLGTNGDPRAASTFRRAIRRTMRIAGPERCVVWSTIVRPPVGGRSYHGLNLALRDEARRRRNLIMFRWSRMARLHPGWFGSDHVHVTAGGYRVRARAMAEQIRRCRLISLSYQRAHPHRGA